MSIAELIKNIGFKIQHTHNSNFDIQEIFFYENYQLFVEYNIETEFISEYNYSLIMRTDGIHFSIIDIFSSKLDDLNYIFIKKYEKEASIIMIKLFNNILRKRKIKNLIN